MQIKKKLELIRILRKYKRSIIVLSCTATGEALYLSTLLDEVENKYGKEVVMVLPPHQLEIPRLCEGNEKRKVFGCDPRVIGALKGLFEYKTLRDTNSILCVSPELKNDYPYDVYREFLESRGRRGLDYYKTFKLMLGVDLDCRMQMPNSELVGMSRNLLQRLGLRVGGYVLFQTGGNSRKPISEKFWSAVARCFEDRTLVLVNKAGALFQVQGKIEGRHVVEVGLSYWDACLLSLGARAIFSSVSGICTSFLYVSRLSYAHTKIFICSSDYTCSDYQPPYRWSFVEENFWRNNRIDNPEIVEGLTNYYEWRVPSEGNEGFYEELVKAMLGYDFSHPHYMGNYPVPEESYD